MNNYEFRVQVGVEYLDKQMPRDEWVGKINLDEFTSIQNPTGCILDQVFGFHHTHRWVVEVGEGEVVESFCADKSDEEQLTAAWRAFITNEQENL